MDEEELRGKLHVASADYDVGYGKPPKETQFKAGRSGNPNGRPKGSKNARNVLSQLMETELRNIVHDEAFRTITVTENGKTQRIPAVQAIVRSMVVRGLRGDPRAQQAFFAMVQANELQKAKIQIDLSGALLKYKVVMEQDLRERKALGIADEPAPLPHPDHIDVDLATGRVEIVGPTTIEEKERWDEAAQNLSKTFEEIDNLEKAIAETPDARIREIMQPDLDIRRHHLSELRRIIEPRRMRALEVEAQRLWNERRERIRVE